MTIGKLDLVLLIRADSCPLQNLIHRFNFQLFIEIPDDLNVYFPLLILGPQVSNVPSSPYNQSFTFSILVSSSSLRRMPLSLVFAVVLSIVFITVIRLIFLRNYAR